MIATLHDMTTTTAATLRRTTLTSHIMISIMVLGLSLVMILMMMMMTLIMIMTTSSLVPLAPLGLLIRGKTTLLVVVLMTKTH